MSLRKTPHVLCGALRVCGDNQRPCIFSVKSSRGECRLLRMQHQPLTLEILTHFALRRPGGRCPWMGSVFRPSHGWRVGKSPGTSHRDLAVSGKAAFFAYFLCGGKESKSPKAKALPLQSSTAAPCASTTRADAMRRQLLRK